MNDETYVPNRDQWEEGYGQFVKTFAELGSHSAERGFDRAWRENNNQTKLNAETAYDKEIRAVVNKGLDDLAYMLQVGSGLLYSEIYSLLLEHLKGYIEEE